MQAPHNRLPGWSRILLHACVVFAFLIVTGIADAHETSAPALQAAGQRAASAPPPAAARQHAMP
ncbi:hypothetical protein [Thauera sinica]|uniref:Uncharacterized protein n=1 Tax=Thauera sinica TaxID=2665146 RepID=A0ABW1AX76_9RHOO|nr:hypothetical protein [Thauera sp. K11]ATE61200.1 hypothetical protein CCZ27_15745 [Thauera sp. K11]